MDIFDSIHKQSKVTKSNYSLPLIVQRVVDECCKTVWFFDNLQRNKQSYSSIKEAIKVITSVNAGKDNRYPPYSLIPTTRFELAKVNWNIRRSEMLSRLYQDEEYKVSENSLCFDSTESPKYERMNKFPRQHGKNKDKFVLGFWKYSNYFGS